MIHKHSAAKLEAGFVRRSLLISGNLVGYRSASANERCPFVIVTC